MIGWFVSAFSHQFFSMSGVLCEMRYTFPSPSRHAVLRPRRGQALIEFSMVAIILVLLLATAGDLARVFYFDVVATSAVREGARVATNTSRSNADISAAVNRAAPGAGLSGVTVSPSTRSSANAGQNVTVSASFTFAPFTPVVRAVIGNTHTYTRTATMQML
jgi:Flp pilus assembly protein TadG